MPPVPIDAGQMHQVFINLLINAADALNSNDTKEGLIKITASAEDDHLIITISDNGPGISDEIFKRLFEPHLTSKEKGHGLGLSTCRQIVNNHGGKIRARNNDDGGASFVITLPLR